MKPAVKIKKFVYIIPGILFKQIRNISSITMLSVLLITLILTSYYVQNQKGIIVSRAVGIVYYVSPTGSGTTCSSSSPCSLDVGYSKLASGDTLYLKSGTYRRSQYWRITKSSITIETAPGEPAQANITGDINGDGVGEAPEIYHGMIEIAYGADYVTIRNLTLSYAYSSAIQIYGNNAVIEDNTIYRATDRNWCNGTAIRKCSSDNNWEGGISWGACCSNTAVATGTIVRRNRVYHISGEALLCMHSNNSIIEDNVIYDNWAAGIDIDQCQNVTIQRNLVYMTADKTWWRGGTGTTNIVYTSEGNKGNTYPVTSNIKIINNISAGGLANFAFWNFGTPGEGIINSVIANNTFIEAQGNTARSIQIYPGSHKNSQFFNNIFYQSQGSALSYGGSLSGLTFSDNIWYPLPPSTAITSAGTNNYHLDPLLTDPLHTRTAGGVNPLWYKIKTSSPSINKGRTVTAFTDDFFKNTRTIPYDIGAHEYNGGGPTGGISSTPTPLPGGKIGDANGDGMVNITDFQLLSNSFGKSAGQSGFNVNADLNKDNVVNVLDFQILSNNFGK